MSARVLLGWVDPSVLEPARAETAEGESEGEGEEAAQA
jgi:hypothetical protein